MLFLHTSVAVSAKRPLSVFKLTGLGNGAANDL